MANNYTLAMLNEIEDEIEFTQWLADEGFITINNVICNNCENTMILQGIFTTIFTIIFSNCEF